jgi:peptidoglycan/xylan/chitin deacetylase (PgdA/CDA1 family)
MRLWTLLVAFALCVPAFGADDTKPVRQMAVTIDDLPSVDDDLPIARYVTKHLLEQLREQRIRAVGFVNEGKLFVAGETEERTAMLTQWLDAGHELGNHTYSHVNNASVPFETYREDVIRGETVTRKLLRQRGRGLRWFRHPYLRTGPTEEYRRQLDALIAELQYVTAPVTIDNNDYVFARAYELAHGRGDKRTMHRLVVAYLDYMEAVVAHFELLSRDFLDREVWQVLLLHANRLNANHLDALVGRLRKRGYEFITLETALQDPAYQLPEAQSARGISWLHRWMLAKGLEMREEPGEPAWVRELAK